MALAQLALIANTVGTAQKAEEHAAFVADKHFYESNHSPISKKYENQITQNGHSRYCCSSIGVTSNAAQG